MFEIEANPGHVRMPRRPRFADFPLYHLREAGRVLLDMAHRDRLRHAASLYRLTIRREFYNWLSSSCQGAFHAGLDVAILNTISPPYVQASLQPVIRFECMEDAALYRLFWL